MNRLVVAGLFGLAVAGCALDRSKSSRSSGPIPTVEMTPPIPSIHEAINRENPTLDPSSVRAGHPSQVVAGPRPRRGEKPALAASDPEVATTTPDSVEPKTAAEKVPEEGQAAAAGGDELAPAIEADQPAPAPVTERPVTGTPEVAPASQTPKDEPADNRVPIVLPRDGPRDNPATAPSGVVPEGPAPAPSPGPAATTAPKIDPAAVRDPLLGPEPDLMPRMDEIPVVKPAKAAPAVPAVIPADPAPEIPTTLPANIPGDPTRVEPTPEASNPVTLPAAPATPGSAPTVSPDPSAPRAPEKPPVTEAPKPQPEPTPTPPSASIASQGDPLLGPKPDLMPIVELDRSSPAKVRAPMEAVPTAPVGPGASTVKEAPPVEVAPPAPPGVKIRNPGAVVMPAAELKPSAPATAPTVVSPKAPFVTEAPRAEPVPTSAAAPRVSADPLLGPEPDVMPMTEIQRSSPPSPAPLPETRPVAPTAPAAPIDSAVDQSVFATTGAEATATPKTAGAPTPVSSVPDLAPAPITAPSVPRAQIVPPKTQFEALPAKPQPRVGMVDGESHEHPKVIDLRRVREAQVVADANSSRPVIDPRVSRVRFEPKGAAVAAPELSLPSSVSKAPNPRPASQSGAPAPAPVPLKKSAPLVPLDPVALPPLEATESGSYIPPRGPNGELPAVIRGSSDPLYDPEVKRANSLDANRARTSTAKDSTAIKIPPVTRSIFEAGKPAARVGDEVITLYELKLAVAMRMRGVPADQRQGLSNADRYRLAKTVLSDLIDRAVVIQEAKRALKNPKQIQIFMDFANRAWTEEELQPLLRQTATTNIYELKEKLSERGESLDDMREQFRQEFLSRGFLEQKIGPKLQVGVPEMREYYLAHLDDYQLPASVTWRELLVEVGKHQSRAEAKTRADALLDRLRRGEDFAKVAKAESDGPNKGDGGLWKTSPNSYAVASVNSAIGSLPLGQISQVIEGPTSFHIIRVEARRDAGPAEFGEVQDKIQRVIRSEKVRRESTAYLDKLRRRTVIWSVFDDPAVQRASVETRISGPAKGPVRR